ncbi:MAG: hypothetical protein R2769_04350 [Saprospiraceae bacterium]
MITVILPAYFSVFGDKACISIDYHFNRSDQVSTLVSIDPRNGPVLDTITSTVENGYKPSIPCVEVYKDEVGDTIIIFQNRQYHFQEVDAKVDLYKYNETKGAVEWKVEDFVEDGNSNAAPLIYDVANIFPRGQSSLFSRFEDEKNLGKKVWSSTLISP